MITVVCCICDDNDTHLRHLNTLFIKYVNAGEWQCESFSEPRTLIHFLHGTKVHLVIMDINLGNENGIECVKEIHSFQPSIVIIFVSANIEYCSPVYAVDHVYFLLKPISETFFNEALQKALHQIQIQQSKMMLIKNKNMVSRIIFDEILYIESDRRKLIFHTSQGTLETYGTLDALFETLDRRFLHCHKSFVVNMDFIKQHTGTYFLLTNKERIPISQLKQSHSKTFFLDYIGESL